MSVSKEIIIKWYNSFWVRFGIVISFIILLVYLANDSRVAHNLNEYLKTEIESLKKENLKLDSLYKEEKSKKEKVRIIKEKVQVAEDLNKIKKLEEELKKLREENLKEVEKISPEELDKYFRNLIKKQ